MLLGTILSCDFAAVKYASVSCEMGDYGASLHKTGVQGEYENLNLQLPSHSLHLPVCISDLQEYISPSISVGLFFEASKRHGRL